MKIAPTLVLILATVAAGVAQPQSPMAWQHVPSITIISAGPDPRLELVDEAISFWNKSLAEIGSAFRLPRAARVVQEVPDEALQAMSASLMRGERPGVFPQALRDLPGDLTVLLGSSEFISFAGPFIAPSKRIMGIRGTDQPPLNFPNVAPNLIAHELGHAIGLGHNADPTMLMCGRPASCRPAGYRSEVARIFPLSADDKRQLLTMYPPDWKPRPR